jgi:hypothetical protein
MEPPRPEDRFLASKRVSASLIGRLGQVHFMFSFPSFGIIVSHPGHASLRSHCWSGSVGPLHACVGLDVERPASSRAQIVAADIFGVIYRPRPVRDDPVSDLWEAVRS